MSNSPLVDYTKHSPNCTKPRKHRIDRITIHHMAGNLSVETCGQVFQTRKASANYGVGTDGRIGLYVDESDRSWASSNAANDHRAVTIEVANDEIGGDWHVSDLALENTIELCVDICKRNGIARLDFTGDTSGNLTMHKWFKATECPGPYLESKFPYIAQRVNERLQGAKKAEPKAQKVVYAKSKDATAKKGIRFTVNSKNGLNVRTSPSAQSRDNIITTLAHGASVTWYGYHTGEWYLVQLADGSTGYVHQNYLRRF